MVEVAGAQAISLHRPHPIRAKYNVTTAKYKKHSPGCKGIYKYHRNKPIHLMTYRELRLVLRLLLRTAKQVYTMGG